MKSVEGGAAEDDVISRGAVDDEKSEQLSGLPWVFSNGDGKSMEPMEVTQSPMKPTSGVWRGDKLSSPTLSWR